MYHEIKEKLLSIVFITMNRKMELLRAIDSCRRSLPQHSEIIVIDNCSTDGTKEAVELYSVKEKIQIKYLYQNTNLGVAGGRNFAFKEAKGKYVFFLDDDAVIASDCFWHRLIEYLDSHNDVVAVSVDIQEPKTGTDLNSRRVYNNRGLSEIPSYCGCAHALKKNFFSRYKRLYPEKLMFGSEELYASFMAWKEKKRVTEFKEIIVNHYPSTINRHLGKDRDVDLIVNQYIIKRLTCPVVVLPITYTVFLLHCQKNGLRGRKWKSVIKKKIDERYEKDDINRMSLIVWIKIIYKFGWRLV